MFVECRLAEIRLCLALVVSLGCVWPVRSDTLNGDVVVVDTNTALSSLKFSAHDQKRIRELFAVTPPNHKIEIECQTISPGGEPIRHAIRLTALNAAGKPDGKEINYVDWYRRATRIAEYRNGLQHGLEQTFDVEIDTPRAEVPWVDGKIHGIKRSFHPDGKVATESTYEKGVIKGQSRSYNEAGKLIRVVPFANGRRDGEAIDYWVDNPDVVERIIPYRKDQVHGVARAFYLNGKLKWERPFKENRQHGVEKQFSAEGVVEKTVYWLNGQSVSAEEYRKQAKE